ncbi:MAG: SDR family NAD(P)-dependent oxidoreductase [Candidatus Kapaibacterium sp.]|nr:MAG: SDR family NAD(P)-dependent oxidoreductase [Candidatus Kapabacteria bacterium]
MKTALVTGANKGIDLEIATELCAKGFHVFLAARTPHSGSRSRVTACLGQKHSW